MKVQIEDKKPCKKVLKISLPSDEVKAAHKKILGEFQERSRLPGFRQGKAPIKIVETRYAQEIKSEILKKLLPKACNEALESEKIRVVSDPVIDHIDFDLEKGLNFQAMVDVFPDIDLPEYKSMKLEKDSVEVKDEDVDQMINELRERHAVFQPVARQELIFDDYAMVDYTSIDEKGKKEEHKNVLIFLKAEDGALGTQLVGMKIGEIRKAHGDSPGKHAKLIFIVKLNEIKEKKLPNLDEDFLKILGEVKSIDDLKEKVRNDIKNYKDRLAQDNLKNRAVRLLSEEASFDIPESQLHQEAQNIYSEIANKVKDGTVSAKSLDEEKIKKDVDIEAARRVRAAYILHGIAQKEGLSVTDEELEQEIGSMALRLGKSPGELKMSLEKSGRIESLRARLTQDKVVDFVLRNAIIQGSTHVFIAPVG